MNAGFQRRFCVGVMLSLLTVFLPAAVAAQNEVHRWERQYYGVLDGQDMLLYGDSATFAKLTFGDLDGDGDADLLVGKRDGHIDRFDNVGRPGFPHWRLAQENIQAILPQTAPDKPAVAAAIFTGNNAAPALVDIDQDGDLDLFVGTGDGRLLFYRNIGDPLLTVFQLITDRFMSENFGTYLAPFFADVNNDRAPDLLLGNGRGDVFLLVNQGSPKLASFCTRFPSPDAPPDEPPPCTPQPARLASIAPESNAVPTLADWDGDGDLDLFIGLSNGTLDYFRNDGTPFVSQWHMGQKRFLAIDTGGYLAPAFLDANGDGRLDIWLGNSTPFVTLYTNKGTGQVDDVWKVTRNVLRVGHFAAGLERAVIASGDLDGDKDPDLIVGSRDGRLIWLENVGTTSVPAWHTRNDDLLGEVGRGNTAPTLADIDGDGDLDLLVGGQDGRLALLRNRGTPKSPSFALETAAFAGIEVGSDSVPVLRDIDGDGDLDLFLGNGRGYIIYYRNEGSRTEPDFRLTTTRFAGLAVQRNAVPTFVDWDGDGRPDLLVGNLQGQMLLALNTGESKEGRPKPWKLAKPDGGRFRVPDHSAPHMADLNGDGKPDLLVGDGEGNVRLWWNRGGPPASKAPDQAAVAKPEGAPAIAADVQPLATTPGAPTTAPAQPLDLNALLASPQAPAGQSGEPARQGPLAPVFGLASDHYGDIRFDSRVVPTFGDLDGDGDLDLVVGVGRGQMVYYRNEGSNKKAVWTKITDALTGESPSRNPSPLLYDLDGDGKLDLLVGTEDGRVLFYRNTSTGAQPAFGLMEGVLAGINVGRNAAPAMARINNDPDSDMLVGNFAGHLYSFLREGGARSLNFKLGDRRFLGVDVGVGATPFVGDLDQDGNPDLLIGSDQGTVLNYVHSTPSKQNRWGWNKGPDYLHGLKFPFGVTPRLADIDGDGDVDLFVGTEKGVIYFFRNEAVPVAGAGSIQ